MGMTLEELGWRMTHDEFMGWCDFFALYPFDDFHRYYRPAVVIAGAMSGDEDTHSARLEWLQPDPQTFGMSEVDRSILKAFTGSK